MAADPKLLEIRDLLLPFVLFAAFFGLIIRPFLEDKADSVNRWLNDKGSRRKRK